MKVIHHKPSGPSTAWKRRKHVCVGCSCCDLTLLNHPFHRSHRRIWQYNSHRFNETLKETNHNLKLTQCHVIVVETSQKKNVLTRDDVLWRKPSNLNIICAIRELFPLCGVKSEPVRVSLQCFEEHERHISNGIVVCSFRKIKKSYLFDASAPP